MKLTRDLGNGNVVSVEHENVKGLFDNLSQVQEVFGETCGKCGGSDISYVVRDVSGDSYYELRCNKKDDKGFYCCKAKISYGQAKDNVTIYPKRKDSEGGWKPTNGWTVWNKETGKEE